jgi:predicted short-subunit dehydrogenase-like oxidoreductase (DUF2520 family)
VHEPSPPSGRAFALVGPGRAGRTVAQALRGAGWSASGVAGRVPEDASTRAAAAELHAPLRAVGLVGTGAELLVIATPDRVIADTSVAAVGALPPGALVVHLAGSLGLDVFAVAAERRPDVRFGALHPLVSIPSGDAAHLAGGWCAVAGDPDVYDLAEALTLTPFTVGAGDRAAYHAAATVAANHLVALLGQVERLAAAAGVPPEAFYPMVRGVLENCATLGPQAALTGPVARGEFATIDAHLAAIPVDERAAYRSLAAAALRLTGRDDPELAARLR